MSTDKPIPEAQNFLVEQALENPNVTHIFSVEEDTVPPAGALEQLLRCDSDIAAIDYGVSGWGCIAKNKQGEILWCGLGCVLIKRKVFETMEYPYFRTDKALRLNDWTWQDLPEQYTKTGGYGGLDIWFCCEARRLGFKIKEIEDMECKHLQLDKLGEKEYNNGIHIISQKPMIEKYQIIEERRENGF